MTTDEKKRNSQISVITVDEVGTAHTRWWDALVAAYVILVESFVG